MTAYFLETSALVKRYVQEAGTAWVQGLTLPQAGSSLYIAEVAGVEAVAAITLRMRRGNTTPAAATVAIADLRRDFARDYSLVQITAPLIAVAMDLAEKHGLRGYDAVQLAAALQVRSARQSFGLSAPAFICADGGLNAAGAAEGLAVDDPNTHP